MRLPSLAIGLLLGAAAPAFALDIIELKSGKVLEVDAASIKGDKLQVRLHTKASQLVAFGIPLDKVVPEFVFYVWAGQVKAGDIEGHRQLAEWARKNGLFSQALRTYEAMAGFDPAIGKILPEIKLKMKAEEATWHFHRAEHYFQEGEMHAARLAAEAVLDQFKDSAEVGRAKELLKIIREREQFLGEEKRKAEIAKRARKQQRLLDRQLYEVAQADRMTQNVQLRNVQDARWKLRYASYLYTRAGVALSDLLPFVETDELRRMIEGHLDAIGPRITRTLIRLADLRYLAGDLGGALDAVHQILDVDPDNTAAVKLRERILDGPGPTHVRYRGGYLGFRRRIYYPSPYYGYRLRAPRAHPYPYARVIYSYR